MNGKERRDHISFVEQRLTLENFVANKYPDLYEDILDDLREPPQREQLR